MKAERHHFRVKGLRAPSVEIDTQAAAVYVRFKKAKVAKTVSHGGDLMQIAIDLDSNGEVVGIEAVGVKQFNIGPILEQARVQVPKGLIAMTRYVPAQMAVAGGVD
jgi:uncharacterized protein YuzE